MTANEQSVRATLDDLADRWRRCTRTIIDLAAFYRLDASHWLTMDTSELTIGLTPSTATLIARGAGVPRGTRGGKRKATARPTPALTGPQARILAALKDAGEPTSPGELAKALKIEVDALRYHTRAMVKAGQIVATGTTASRRLALPT